MVAPSRLSTASPGPDGSFPAQVLGMPVLSTRRAHELVTSGALAGRVAAIEGYVNYPVWLDCPLLRSGAFLIENCMPPELTEFSDIDHAGASITIAFGPEASGAQLTPRSDTKTNGGYPVVVIGHTGDIRSAQCQAAAAPICASRFVVDRVAWLDGHDVDLIPASLEPAPSWIPDDASQSAGEIALSSAPSAAGSLGQFDPRLNGMTGATTWFMRYAVGAADASGTFASEERVYDDTSRSQLMALPASPPSNYQTGRIDVLSDFSADVPSSVSDGAQVRVDVTSGDSDVTSDRAAMLVGGPIVVEPGSYNLDVYLVDHISSFNPALVDIGYPHCAADVTVLPGGFASITATFNQDTCAARTNPTE